MSETIIRRCTISDLESAPRLKELLAAYAAESHIPELGIPEASWPIYRAMESAGALNVIGAFSPDLVGVVILLVYGLPHYAGRKVGTLESFFVLPEERQSGAGMKLLHAAEELAAELGANGLLISAPIDGRLDAILPRSGYRPSNRVYVRILS